MEQVNEKFNANSAVRVSIEEPAEPAKQKHTASFEVSAAEQPPIELAKAVLPGIERTNQILKKIYETWDKDPYGYQWPASRLSRHEMARLTIVSNRVKRPLNQLIKEAVDLYATMMLEELGYVTGESA